MGTFAIYRSGNRDRMARIWNSTGLTPHEIYLDGCYFYLYETVEAPDDYCPILGQVVLSSLDNWGLLSMYALYEHHPVWNELSLSEKDRWLDDEERWFSDLVLHLERDLDAGFPRLMRVDEALLAHKGWTNDRDEASERDRRGVGIFGGRSGDGDDVERDGRGDVRHRQAELPSDRPS